jgi:hypothetical protein
MAKNIVDQKAFSKREGNSDKIYVLYLVNAGNDRYLVQTAYGPRTAGPKGKRSAYKTKKTDSQVPVFFTLDEARDIFDKVVGTRESHHYNTFNNWEELEVFNALVYE